MAKVPPRRVAAIASAVRDRARGLVRRMVPAPIALLELATGFVPAQLIYAAAELGVADELAAGPRAAADVADAIGADRDATYRLLRACAGWGLFAEDSVGRFRLTPLGGPLCRDRADSIRPAILMVGDPVYQRVWGELPHAVRTGQTGAEKLYGKSMWEYTETNVDLAATFDDAMTCLSALDWPTVAAVYDFSRFSTIVDVGGGRGQLLAQILGTAPEAKGVLFDRDVTLAAAGDSLRDAGVSERCSIESGSFFDSVPAGGDLYVIRRVLHDWPDDDAVAILRTIRRSMSPTSTLLVIESVVPEGNTPHFAKDLDLDMLLFVGGRERTRAQWTAVLDSAGFAEPRIVPTISTVSLIEARCRE